jgi:hypothetical protein
VDGEGGFVVRGSVYEDSNRVEFIKQYTGGGSVFFNGHIMKGKVIGEWTLFDGSDDKKMVDYFEIEMRPDVVLSGMTKSHGGEEEKIVLNLSIQDGNVFGIGYDKSFGSYSIRGDYNKSNG